MKGATRLLLLPAGLVLSMLLAGCPGMPGAPGGQQQMPPGVTPPPGLESGGARTLMGTTVTPPEDGYLLVSYSYEKSEGTGDQWQICRRVMPLESCILVEGLNYDGRVEGAQEDVNILLPYEGLESFSWKYETKPEPPAEAEESGEGGEEESGE